MAIDELQTLAIITYVLDFLIKKKKFLLNEGSFRLTITNHIHIFKSLNNDHKIYEKWRPISASFCLSK